jgi:hypothetical protein
MKKKLMFFSIVVLMIVVGGFFGFRYYKINSTMSSVETLIHNISLRVSNDARYEYEPSTITFKELFEKLEKDISEIDSKIIDIQSLPTTFCADRVSTAVSYAQSCQELLRALLNKNRKSLNESSASDRANEAWFSNLSDEYAMKRFHEANENASKSFQESKDAAKDLSTIIEKTDEARKKALEVLPAKSIIEPSVMEKLKKSNDDTLKQFE